MVKRPEWNEYFGEITKQVALRSTCVRKKVGAIIVKDKNIISTGYNGSIRGLEHCETVGCLMMEGHCTRTIHAEANAIIQAAKHGLMIDRAEIYISASPCFNCFKLIANVFVRTNLAGDYRQRQLYSFYWGSLNLASVNSANKVAFACFLFL